MKLVSVLKIEKVSRFTPTVVLGAETLDEVVNYITACMKQGGTAVVIQERPDYVQSTQINVTTPDGGSFNPAMLIPTGMVTAENLAHVVEAAQ